VARPDRTEDVWHTSPAIPATTHKMMPIGRRITVKMQTQPRTINAHTARLKLNAPAAAERPSGLRSL